MIPAATATAIEAIAALAKAGGSAYAGAAQGDMQEEEMALQRRKLLLDEQARQDQFRREDKQNADMMEERRRVGITGAPASSINLLSGLAGLRNGLSQNNGLDVLNLLAKG